MIDVDNTLEKIRQLTDAGDRVAAAVAAAPTEAARLDVLLDACARLALAPVEVGDLD